MLKFGFLQVFATLLGISFKKGTHRVGETMKEKIFIIEKSWADSQLFSIIDCH